MERDNFKKNALWNTIGITFNSFNSLFFLIIINRVNGIDAGGVFSFAFSLACLLFVVGIYSGRTYQVADKEETLNDREYLVHKIITCIMMLLFGFGYVLFQQYSFEKNSIIIGLTIYKCLEAFSDTLYGYMQKRGQLYLAGISLFVKSIISIIVFCIIDILTKNLLLSCISLVVTNLIVIFAFDLIKAKKLMKKEKIRTARVLSLFKSGFSVFAFSFLAIYIVNVPKYTIDTLLANSFQTVFNIIVMPATVISLCGQYIMGPYLTGMVEDFSNQNYEDFKNKIYRIIKIILLFWVIIEIGAYLLGIPVLSIIYAIDLAEYKIDLLIIIGGAVLYAIANVFSNGLITMKKNNIQLIIYLISSLIGLIASNVLIRAMGIHGATYAYAVTMICHGIMYICYFNYEYKKLEGE